MKRKGFTLIELLVVIAVISLLLGILVPVVSMAGRRTENFRAAARVSELGLACLMYQKEAGRQLAVHEGHIVWARGRFHVPSNPQASRIRTWNGCRPAVRCRRRPEDLRPDRRIAVGTTHYARWLGGASHQ